MVRWILFSVVIYIVMKIISLIIIYYKKVKSEKDRITVNKNKSKSSIDKNDIIDAQFEDLDDKNNSD
ncbi:MAG: hypothetical protein JW866_06815 [Ignavibacteriales bacterium]|nr:hypothetical protein [Ignavibacteriales bacterium]